MLIKINHYTTSFLKIVRWKLYAVGNRSYEKALKYAKEE